MPPPPNSRSLYNVLCDDSTTSARQDSHCTAIRTKTERTDKGSVPAARTSPLGSLVRLALARFWTNKTKAFPTGDLWFLAIRMIRRAVFKSARGPTHTNTVDKLFGLGDAGLTGLRGTNELASVWCSHTSSAPGLISQPYKDVRLNTPVTT